MPGPFAPDADGYSRGPFLPPAVRLWFPVVFSLFVQVMAVGWQLSQRDAGRLEAAAAISLALIGPVALVGARRFPGPVVAVATAAAVADLLINPGLDSPYVALAFAIVLAMIRGARLWALVSVASGWLLAFFGATLLGISWFPGRIIVTTIGLVIALGIGDTVRTRRARFAERRRQASQRRMDAAQQERVRIARELHDVLAHSLSQINVQAGVGLHLIESRPEAAADALASIKSTSKAALDEVRSVLGILRSDDDPAQRAAVPLVPQPDLARLEELVESVGTPSLRVRLDDHIRSSPPAATQLALYRMAQESLTNIVRHSGAATARVELFETDSDYVLRVTDDGGGQGTGQKGAADPAPGKGLLGMAERAELLGGRLTTGDRDGGGFGVTATIPREQRGVTQ